MKSFNLFSLLVAGSIGSAIASPFQNHVARDVRSPDATCGGKKGYTCLNSGFGDCCSRYGYCGSTSSYCGTDCQSQFGSCVQVPPVSQDAKCGANDGGSTCLGSQYGDCCSQNGWCGSTSAYCGTGCQSAFGTCQSQITLPSSSSSHSSSTRAATSSSRSSSTARTASSSARTSSSSSASSSSSRASSKASSPSSSSSRASSSSTSSSRASSSSSSSSRVSSSSSSRTSSASSRITSSTFSSVSSSVTSSVSSLVSPSATSSSSVTVSSTAASSTTQSLSSTSSPVSSASSTPTPVACPTAPIEGFLQILDATTNAELGYVASTYGGGTNIYTLTTISTHALLVLIVLDPGSNCQQLSIMPGTQANSYSYLGLVNSYNGPFGMNMPGQAYLTDVGFTPPGSPPMDVGNDENDASPSESTIWNYDPSTAYVSAQWINPDGSSPATHSFYDQTSGYLGAAGDVDYIASTNLQQTYTTIQYKFVSI